MDENARRLRALPWPVTTDRLLIRPTEAADAEAVWAIRSQPGVSRWLPSEPGELAAFCEDWMSEVRFPHTLVMEHDGRVIGDLMVRIEDAWAQREVREQAAGAQAELGWVVAPAYAGRGLATEAVAALLAICFDGLGLRRVSAVCFSDNVASWRLMERLGMRREEHNVRDSLHRELGWLDGYGYALLADEWRS